MVKRVPNAIGRILCNSNDIEALLKCLKEIVNSEDFKTLPEAVDIWVYKMDGPNGEVTIKTEISEKI